MTLQKESPLLCNKCKEDKLFCKCWRDNMDWLKDRALGL